MEEKKILTILLGSPRAGGNTEALADALARGAEGRGYEIRKVRLSAMKLNGCIDCRKCWSTGTPCVQKDDMDKVYADIEAASVIAFASPLYYYSWSAQIKPVWDRSLPFYMPGAARTITGKKAILLAAAGDKAESKFEGMTASFKNSAEFMGFEIAGIVCAPGMYVKGDIESKGESYLAEAEALGSRL